MTTVGQSIPALNAWEKVSGTIPYTVHLELPGMVHGKIFRNRVVPHGRIVRLDVSRAARLPGVLGILTGADVARRSNPCFGAVIKDQPIVAFDRVRFVGDPVAVVAALTAEIAEEAVALIEAEYEELPALLDARAAMREGAPLIHGALTRSTTIFDPASVPVVLTKAEEKTDCRVFFLCNFPCFSTINNI